MGMSSLLIIRRAHTNPHAWTVESRYCHRNPPSAPVPCSQSICCQPSNLVTYRWAPSRHRNSPVRFCSRDSVTCRSFSSLAVVSSLKVVSDRQRILLRSLLPLLCRQHSVIFTFVAFRRLSTATVRATHNRIKVIPCCRCFLFEGDCYPNTLIFSVSLFCDVTNQFSG